MNESEARPYHHGDLRRALIGAARNLLETEGPEALSLRAVAREAGVSPAAPYHHFKDKNELLSAVANQGYEELAQELRRAQEETASGPERLAAMGAAFASFAHHRRPLYRIMSSSARTREQVMSNDAGEMEVMRLMFETTRECMPHAAETELRLTALANMAAVHGLAELSAFKMMDQIKAELGGEQAFLRAVMRHLGAFSGPAED